MGTRGGSGNSTLVDDGKKGLKPSRAKKMPGANRTGEGRGKPAVTVTPGSVLWLL